MTYELNKRKINEGITYNSLHWWLRRKYGKANKCTNENCEGRSPFFQWALRPGKEYERNIENFQMLCRSCHFKNDLREFQKNKFDEGRKKAHKTRVGMKHTDETRKKISLALANRKIYV